ncbi:MAG: hypothetical protein LBU70_00560 [Chitinispirillales bacterium]|nr:hypothetical protein [Chitinispirillales bacterium]
MKNKSLLMVLILVSIGACLSLINAQPSMRFRGSDGWGPDTRYEQLFDNFNLRTHMGKVVRVDTATHIRGEMSVGMRLIIAFDNGEEIPVHLGPMWFAVNQDINFPRGESVEIRGHRTNLSGSEFIMPVEIRSRHRAFRFRDDDGKPFWTVIRPR